MAAATKYALAAAGSTGNNTHAAVAPVGRSDAQIAAQFVVEAAGATPTVTFKVQGSLDGTNWYDLLYLTDGTDTASAATRTVTAVGASVEFISQTQSRTYTQFRLVTTANTNITYRGELYAYEVEG